MKRKGAALLAAVILLGLALTGCTQAGRRTAAMKFLNKDIVAIANCARETLETREVPEGAAFDGVEDIHYHWMPDHPWVAFVTGSRDEPGNEVEVGFYYSPDNEPIGWYGCIPREELVPDALTGEKYTWKAKGYDASYYTEYMQVGWYYYEMNGQILSTRSR